ncbi:U6 snRNA-associated Sm-like protein [Acrasis kona]|uniref:U6 snRNA-associated Sm-like protein n=1 Tax=Acrasis kona TaxID=1008807 RepID=A0AAW2ZBT1_9EUKA
MSGRKPRENILNLEKSLDKEILIKFNGGREVIGTLKGYDSMVNIVLDNTKEFIRDVEDHNKLKWAQDPENSAMLVQVTRNLGIVVCRGTSIMYLCPVDGTYEINNPFIGDEEEEEQ